ncbi:probable inactive receptor kinase [Tanacetum coccineum]
MKKPLFLFTTIIIFILLDQTQTQKTTDLSSDRAALITLRSSLSGRTLLWPTTQPTPCNWSGVQCDPSLNRVVALHLPANSLSGVIPSGIFSNLTELKTLSLRFNSLTGLIPSDLSQCHNLRNLYLQGNRFSGVFPEVFFGSLRGLVRVNVGGNRLSGQISSGFANFTRLRTLYLEGNLKRRRTKKTSAIGVGASKMSDAEGLGEKPLTGTGGTGSGSNGFSVAAAAAAAMTTSSAAAGGNASAAGDVVEYESWLAVTEIEGCLRFLSESLGVVRLNFVFRGNGSLNLVPLRAYYYSKEEKLLVYDYMPMGSLSALLHGNKGGGRTPLNWEIRSAIALGAARGIEYLHSHGDNISHGNIKSSNVLLTKSLEARISDFGLAHLVGLPSTPNRVAGYRAPEVTDPRRVSQKADVYSFGVLVLELLTGKAPTHALLNEEGVDLPRWVQSTVKEEWTSEVFDLELLRYQNVEEEMVQLLQLAIDCAAQYPDNRPTMSEVTKRIEELRGSSLVKGADQGHGLESD